MFTYPAFALYVHCNIPCILCKVRAYQQVNDMLICLNRGAFVSWAICIIFLHIVVRYGGYMALITSALLFLAGIVFSCIRNPLSLRIPFEDATIDFVWGWCYWLNFLNGKRKHLKAHTRYFVHGTSDRV